MRIDAIIPAFDEAPAIGDVVRSIRRLPVTEVLVGDNGSTDDTAEKAREAGAVVVFEPRKGYGSACLACMARLSPETDIVVYLDGDGADDPTFLPELVRPIVEDRADFVVGSRTLGRAERGSMTFAQRAGNRIASLWLRWRFGMAATDLGPFRAIRRRSLDRLEMSDPDFGWTVEMQIKAARHGLRYAEIPVPYRNRIGRSKVSGTLRGALGAAYKILGLLFAYDFLRR